MIPQVSSKVITLKKYWQKLRNLRKKLIFKRERAISKIQYFQLCANGFIAVLIIPKQTVRKFTEITDLVISIRIWKDNVYFRTPGTRKLFFKRNDTMFCKHVTNSSGSPWPLDRPLHQKYPRLCEEIFCVGYFNTEMFGLMDLKFYFHKCWRCLFFHLL